MDSQRPAAGQTAASAVGGGGSRWERGEEGSKTKESPHAGVNEHFPLAGVKEGAEVLSVPRNGCKTRVTVPPEDAETPLAWTRRLASCSPHHLSAVSWPAGTPEALQDRVGLPRVPLQSPAEMSGYFSPASVTLSLMDIAERAHVPMDFTPCLQSLAAL